MVLLEMEIGAAEHDLQMSQPPDILGMEQPGLVVEADLVVKPVLVAATSELETLAILKDLVLIPEPQFPQIACRFP